nr:NADP-dependent malic enzyme-like [Onthophagus taurus]
MASIQFVKSLIQRSLCSALKQNRINFVRSASLKGIEYLKNSKINKDAAFTLEERRSLGIHGLLPSTILTQEDQLQLCKERLKTFSGDDVKKSIFLYDLQERNEKLFYKVINENLSDLLPIIYTPTINKMCNNYGLLFTQPKGLFLNNLDIGRIPEVLKNWPESDVKIVIATDGENLQPNLGDMGVNSMLFPVGKSTLYTGISGIKPHQCLPITLDVGTNNEKLLKDPSYLGLRQKRITGQTYLDFIDEVITSIINQFGQNTIIQFEGFNRENSLTFLKKYQKKCCFLIDDLQCKGAVVLAGLMASEAILNKPIKDYTMLFLGIDETTFEIANTLVKHIMEENGSNLSPEMIKNNIWMFDNDGLLTQARIEGKLFTGDKVIYAKDFEPTQNPVDVINKIKPNVLIGNSEAKTFFKPDVLYQMAEVNQKPVIFALNENSNSSFYQDIYHHTQGKAILATSSIFKPEILNKTSVPGHASSCLIYPGLTLGVMASGLKNIPDELFGVAARCIAEQVTYEDLKAGRIFPRLELLKNLSIDLATKICEYSFKEGLSTIRPEPQDKKFFIKSHLYNYEYEDILSRDLEWVEMAETSTEEVKKGKNSAKLNENFEKSVSEDETDKIEDFVDTKNEKSRKVSFDDVNIVERFPPESFKTKSEPTA